MAGFLALAIASAALCGARGTSLPAMGGETLPAGEKYVALTFDDGPRRGTTDRLLDGLKERGIKATFFLIGSRIQDHADLVARMAEEGHQIGNHTWSHVHLGGEKADAQEVQRTETALEELLGGEGYWLRPPYGDVPEGMELRVPLVKWSVDPRDWESRNAAQVTQAVLRDARPNAIILLHDIYPSSVEAALKIVDALEAEGYWFVTVEELLRLNGVTPEAGVMYRSGEA